MSLSTSGDKGYVTFSGTTGANLGVGFTSDSFSSFTFKLNNPSGSTVYTKTVFSSTKDANLPPLLATGTYTIVIDPGSATGSVTLTLSADLTDTITIGGSAKTATISRVGQNERLTFTGTTGENLGLAMTSTTFSTGTVTLWRSNGTQVSVSTGTFVSTGGTSVNWVSLPANDTYTALVDPGGATGAVTLTLSDDLTDTITVGGSAKTATISRAGQNERLTFTGTAGENLGLAMTSTSFSSGSVTLYKSDGTQVSVSTGSFVSTGSTSANWIGLPANDTYTAFVDPGIGTGAVTLTLSDDQTGTIASDGGPLAFSLSRVGQNERLTFAGANTQSLDLLISGSSFTSSSLKITNPDGSTAANVPVVGSGSSLTTFTVGGNGVSTIFFDPGIYTGSASFLLRPSGEAPASSAQLTACGTTPVFRAQPAAGASPAYQFQVASDSGFSSVVSDSGSVPSTNTYSPPAGTLANGQTYYWRWKTASGSWSSGRSFSLNQSHVGADGSPTWSDGPLAVNEVSGNLLVSLPGPQYPTAIGAMGASVSYNSLRTTDQGLGAGWLLDSGGAADAPLELVDLNLLTGADRLDALVAVFSDGSSTCFSQVGQTNSFVSAPGDGTVVSKNADGSWTYLSGDTIANFAAADGQTGLAQLTSVESASAAAGNGKLTYSFSTSDPSKVTSITDTSGRSVSFTWHSLNAGGCSNAIVCVSGPDGVSWRYVGDGSGGTSGRLATINDGSRDIATLSYDGSGRVNKLQNADDLDPTHASSGYNGSHAVAVSYDGSGRVATIANGPISDQTSSTSTTSFAYTPGSVSTTATRANHGTLGSGSVRTAAGYTTVTPPNQQGPGSPKSVKVYYDGHGNLLERDDILGNVSEAGYNNRDELTWTEDEDGNPTDYTYDTLNDVPLTATGPDPDGVGSAPRPVTSSRYDETTIGTSSTPGTGLQGLQGAYYDNLNLAGRPKLRENDSSVDFSWGSGGPTGLGATDHFSVRWTGTITLPSTGNYVFSVRSDEGARLVVGRIVAIDNWTDQTVTTVSSPAYVYTAGSYKIALEYYDNTGSAEVHLRWACSTCSPAITDQVIPSSALQPAWENQTSTVSPGGRISFSHYANPETGLPDYTLAVVGSSNLITSYSYDSSGRITQTAMPKANASATIDSSGNLSSTPDSTYITTFSYYAPSDTVAPPSACGGGSAVNQAGQLETKAVHGLSNRTLVYDIAGRLISEADGAGTTCHSYDAEGRLTSEKAPGDTASTTYSYDPAGLLLTATDAGGTNTYSYDEAGRVKDTIDSYGAEASYAYDNNGNVLTRLAATGSLSSSTNYTATYSYDEADHLTGENDAAGRSYSFFYDNRGNLKATQYPNGTFSWADINPLGELTGLYNRHDSTPLTSPLPTGVPADSSSSPIVDYTYSYNSDGQKSEEVRSGGGLTTVTSDYTYDTLGRLSQVLLPDGTCRSYAYDLDSNRTQIQEASSGCAGSFSAVATYTYDPATTSGVDELTSQTGPSRSFSYDTDGEMTNRGGDTINWDGWGRTTGGAFGSTSVAYIYDATGVLRSRVAGSNTTRYVNGGLFETNASGTITTSYADGPASDLASFAGAPTSATTVSYLYYSGHGDLAAEANSTGSRTADHAYDPFGASLDTQPANTTIHRYTGAWNEPSDTSSSLVLMGVRPYDPNLGRFLTVDPIDGGSLNSYDYAGQDAINNYDLDGLTMSPYAMDSPILMVDQLSWGTFVRAMTGSVVAGSLITSVGSHVSAQMHHHGETAPNVVYSKKADKIKAGIAAGLSAGALVGPPGKPLSQVLKGGQAAGQALVQRKKNQQATKRKSKNAPGGR